ncbi:PAS domain-containing sensor histidine kinase [Sunxiuqinia indica]|uniref:PAS domain-containing sensor histidine kinase n=1 Tax=Sunxiuqinia indica TaxID=2692584 RepID=UPI001357F289|nr:PAS domain-containing sensor histidine kinase [Sunxiuqinia indica]
MRSGYVRSISKVIVGSLLGGIILMLLMIFREFVLKVSSVSWDGILLILCLGGITGGLIGYLLDRNTKKTTALKESEKKYQTLINQSLDGIYIEDERGNILECNTQGHRMFGYTKEEMLKLSLRDLVSSEFRDLIPDLIPDEMATEDVYLERENVKKDGTVFPTEINTKFITLDGERRLIAYVKDNTEKKKIEEALKKSEAKLRDLNIAKDKILSIIAHDLKNQFNAILGYCDLIQEDGEQLERRTLLQYAAEVNLTANETYSLLENLLDWAMMQKEMASFNPVHIQLSKLVNQVIDTLSGTAHIKKIKLTGQVGEELAVYADQNMLRTVIRNLTANAIKFTPRNGRIELCALPEKDNQSIVIEIKDNGIGITQEKLDRLFSMQSHESTFGTDNEKGSGLGLIVCKEFIERHDGKIWAKSEKGEGSSFFVELPRAN